MSANVVKNPITVLTKLITDTITFVIPLIIELYKNIIKSNITFITFPTMKFLTFVITFNNNIIEPTIRPINPNIGCNIVKTKSIKLFNALPILLKILNTTLDIGIIIDNTSLITDITSFAKEPIKLNKDFNIFPIGEFIKA